MLRDIADIVIREMNNTVMPVPILVSDMSWDDDRRTLNKRLRTNPGREPVEPEVLEALFLAKVVVVLGQSTSFSYEDIETFLEAIKPGGGVQVNITPVFG